MRGWIGILKLSSRPELHFLTQRIRMRCQKLLNEDYHVPVSYMTNVAQQERENKSLYTIVAFFLYGFIAVISLIGVTNIFNTITTSMELRSKEFAMLRSVGMTEKEFQRMVRLESLFYGSKALIVGLAAGTFFSWLIYLQLSEGMDIGYHPPILRWLSALLQWFCCFWRSCIFL